MKSENQNKDFLKNRQEKKMELNSYLTPVMNELHEVQFSERFWLTFMGDYIKTCVNRTPYLTKKMEKYHIPFLPINMWTPPDKKVIFKQRVLYFMRAFYKRSTIKQLTSIIKNNDDICIGIRGKDLEEAACGTYANEVFPIFLKSDRKKRKKLKSIADKETDIFKKNMLLQAPLIYVEYFQNLLNKVPEEKFINKKYFHHEHVNSFLTKLIFAKYAEEGAKIYSYQTGGFAGETIESISPIRYETIDKFYTYGWKIHEKDFPFFGVRLEQFKKEYLKWNGGINIDILLVFGQIINSLSLKEYYRNNVNLFFELVSLNKKKLIIRPRSSSRKFDNSKQLNFFKIPENCEIDKGMKPLAGLCAQTKLVVQFTHPSTNFLECVYVDQPIVAIISNKQPTEIVKPFYEFFLSIGVMHHNMESLIEHINSVDIDEWWSEVIEMEKYKEFKHTFARAAPDS